MNAIVFSAISGVIMMLTGIFVQSAKTLKNIAIVVLLGLIVANLASTYGWFSISFDTQGLLGVNKYGLFFNTILFVATFFYLLLSGNEITKLNTYSAEYFALIFFVLCGVSVLTSFNSLLMFFLGIEILSIPLYILTGSDKRNLKSNEASLKYFLMGSFSTGILLMGIALVYGATGTFGLAASGSNNEFGSYQAGILAPVGLLLIFVSMLFKVSAAPFHFWTPDVYDGAPGVFTSFMATIVKAAGFYAFVQLFQSKSADLVASWKILLNIVIVLTLLVGNITAVFQQSVKRMLAYSSIAQAGFMLFALYANTQISKEGLAIYAIAYCLATVGIFAVMTKMEDYTFDGFNGLAKTNPLIAFATTVCLLSLAGIPLTAGFFAKYFMLASAVQAGASLVLLIIAVLFAAVSVYYYFKVIQAMYFKNGNVAWNTPITLGFQVTLLIVAVLIIVIGVLPNTVLQWIYF